MLADSPSVPCVRDEFMTFWLQTHCQMVYNAEGDTIIVDLAVVMPNGEGRWFPHFTHDSLIDLISFLVRSELFPVNVILLNFDVDGVDVARMDVDFSYITVTLTVSPPIAYAKLTDLEDVLGKDTTTDFTFEVEVDKPN